MRMAAPLLKRATIAAMGVGWMPCATLHRAVMSICTLSLVNTA
jgi:hypothetical protein